MRFRTYAMILAVSGMLYLAFLAFQSLRMSFGV